jgi:hypothetical protein
MGQGLRSCLLGWNSSDSHRIRRARPQLPAGECLRIADDPPTVIVTNRR